MVSITTARIFLALAGLGVSLASLYPVIPVMKTVWTAGSTEQIAWIDDNQTPHLSQLGLMDIKLFVGNHTYVATLARDVEPMTCYHSVSIPVNLCFNIIDYTIRFVFKSPPIIVYTADFIILSSGSCTSSESVPSGNHIISDYAAMSSSFSITPLASTQATSSSAISRISGTSSISPSTTVVADALGQGDAGVGLHGNASKAKGAASINGRIDIEKLKFRIVFVIWPALVGISMAL